MSEPQVERTPRGFEFVRFHDRAEMPCTLRQSSLADFTQPGTSAVWLGADDAGIPAGYRMHLDREQVHWLIGKLIRWLSDGSFEAPEALAAQDKEQGDE